MSNAKKRTGNQQSPGEFTSKFTLRAASLIISFAALIYLGYHFTNSFSNEIETEYALMTTENDIISLDGYILRRENIIYSNSAGSCGYLVTDGTKVKNGGTVANIYSASGADEDLLVDIDKKLEILSASSVTEGISSSDTGALDTKIASAYMSIRQNSESGLYSTLQKRRDELLTLINKRKVITGEVESYNDMIEDLTAQRDYITAQNGEIAESVTTSASGYFYSELDGYEGIFGVESVQTMDLDIFDSMLSTEPKTYSANAVGKLCPDFEWYIVSECTRDSLRYFTKGSYYTVGFPYNSDVSIRMELVNVYSEIGNDRVLVVFRSGIIPEDFSFRRMQPIEVVRSSHTGYKVPISASRLVDGVQGVYILDSNMVVFKQTDILLELDGYYIVAPQDIENDPDYKNKLALYDQIVVSGKDLYVGKMIS